MAVSKLLRKQEIDGGTMKTRITELLNIDYPIFQGGMAWVADGDLAGAVSKAGGLALSVGEMPRKKLSRQILTRSNR